VALQTIKSICRRPWGEGVDRFAACWYEPLTEQADVDKAVAYVLARPQVFLNMVGDIYQLPNVLKAASRFTTGPSDSEMAELVRTRAMIPLWPEHAAA
jgi:hypothetical protein